MQNTEVVTRRPSPWCDLERADSCVGLTRVWRQVNLFTAAPDISDSADGGLAFGSLLHPDAHLSLMHRSLPTTLLSPL